ncbi:MAG: hypothetical protein ACTS5I_13190 [Rhodanobacter sp.]
MNEPASVQAERARLAAQRMEGALDGYYTVEPLPAFMSKAANRLTAYEQGYFWGKMLRQFEKENSA